MADSFTSPRSVPSLDAIAERPEDATGLRLAPVLALHAKAVRALAALEGALLAALNGHEERTEDRLLDVDAAADRLQRSKDWLYRNARNLPFTVQEGKGGKLRFSRDGIERYIREKQGQMG